MEDSRVTDWRAFTSLTTASRECAHLQTLLKKQHQSVIHALSDATQEAEQNLAIVLEKILDGYGAEFALAMDKTLSYGDCDSRENLNMALIVCVLSGTKMTEQRERKEKSIWFLMRSYNIPGLLPNTLQLNPQQRNKPWQSANS